MATISNLNLFIELNVQEWTYIIVGLTFSLYIGIAIWSRVHTTKEFYVAGAGVSPLANGMATAADWMSAASFISMAGIIAFSGYDGAVYLMGWTGGYVRLALLLRLLPSCFLLLGRRESPSRQPVLSRRLSPRWPTSTRT